MKVGLVGKPNVGKSTFFSAATLADAQIGDYPFTTIDANTGVAAVRVPDPGQELGVTSSPKHGRVEGDTRFVPVQLVDVAGLVPGAHEGRGLGNKFLTDLSQADVLIHVIDASGSTDAEGNPVDAGSHDPLEDVRFLENEIDHWIDGILADGWDRLTRRVQQEGRRFEAAISERLAGIGVRENMAYAALRACGLTDRLPTKITAEDRLVLARAIRAASKPIFLAWNKADLITPERFEELQGAVDLPGVAVGAQCELALRKGAAGGALSYVPGASSFTPGDNLSEAQKKGLAYMQEHVLDRFGSSGVQRALEACVLELLDFIPVFPVEDESKLTDKDGNVLPDCHLVPRGTTAKGLAYRVHTDLGDHFVRGIDCRTKRAVGADHELESGAVLKIAATA